MQGKDLILPNAGQRWCTADMKSKVLDRYCKHQLGITSYTNYIGMRYDEPTRVDSIFRLNDSQNNIWYDCPAHWLKLTKLDVSHLWLQQPVDLGLINGVNVFRDFIGNCTLCHLKAKIKKLYIIQQGYSIAFYKQLEIIVSRYNQEIDAMSRQAGTYESLETEAKSMRRISIQEVLSDTEVEKSCVGCGD